MPLYWYLVPKYIKHDICPFLGFILDYILLTFVSLCNLQREMSTLRAQKVIILNFYQLQRNK